MRDQPINLQSIPAPHGDKDPKRKPAIRTMKTDLAEFRGSGRVSVAQVISEELKTHPPRVVFQFQQPRSKKPVLLFGMLALMLTIAGVATYIYISSRPPTKPAESPKPPPFIFGTERSLTIVVKIQERLGFLKQLEAELKDLKRTGTITGIVLKIIDGPRQSFASLDDLMKLMDFKPPVGFIQQVESNELMLFVYQGTERNNFGVAARVKDPNRAFREMFLWEKSLLEDFFPFLFDGTISTIGVEFQDKAYHNIDYRFAKLSPEKDLGVGYTVFPARKTLIITTSQEAIERVIDRLFDTN